VKGDSTTASFTGTDDRKAAGSSAADVSLAVSAVPTTEAALVTNGIALVTNGITLVTNGIAAEAASELEVAVRPAAAA
jgi:hypothetical protein